MQINHNRFLWYIKDGNKQLVIDPVEAEVVKRIYREYLEGASLLDICKGLEAGGILTGAGLPKWRPEKVETYSKMISTLWIPCFKRPTP